jgi:hypothetical protein
MTGQMPWITCCIQERLSVLFAWAASMRLDDCMCPDVYIGITTGDTRCAPRYAFMSIHEVWCSI